MTTVDALTTILLTPDAMAEMAAAHAGGNNLSEMIAWPCDDEDDEKTLIDFLSAIQERLRTLERARKTIAEPLTAAKKALDALFSTAEAPYEAAKESIKNKLERAEDRRRETYSQALILASDARKEGDAKKASKALTLAASSSKKAGGASYTYSWEWELEDIAQVPIEFLALNYAVCRSYTQRFKNSETIEGVPGIVFKRVAKVIAR